MIGIVDWARDLLVSRGALVETEEAGALRALLPAELAAALESREWLSLRFGGGAGASDEIEWLDRLSRLLPPDARVVSAVSYTHLRAHETRHDLVCRLLLEKKKTENPQPPPPHPTAQQTPHTTPNPKPP